MARFLHFSLAFHNGMCDHIDTVIRPRLPDGAGNISSSPLVSGVSRCKSGRRHTKTLKES